MNVEQAMGKISFMQAAGGLNNIVQGIIAIVLVFLFFHHVKSLARSYQMGLIGGNVVVGLIFVMVVRFEVLTAMFLLFLCDVVMFAIISMATSKSEARVSELEEQLVDALLILSGSLKAGRSLEQGFDLVQKSLAPPISHEFIKVLQDQSLGIPFEKALKQMLERVPSNDYRLFVTATLFQRETGGNIIALYEEIIKAIADRKKVRGRMESMSVQGRYSGYIIASLPLAMFAVLTVINRDYVSVFWTVPWAKTLFILAIVLEITGIVTIRAILNRKVA